jgi:DNA-binding SARP family transcriptional activator/CheY-like chemotaxis protein
MSYQILLVEDDLDLRETMLDVLSEQGYQVLAVASGQQAVKEASHRTFDLVITDIRMEGMDGLEALERTRKIQPSVSSLVVSGYASEHETLKALSLNVGGYLKKPFAVQEFLNAVADLLARRGAESERNRELLSLRRALKWSLENSARLGEELSWTSTRGRPDEAGALAYRLATALGLAPPACEQIRLATMLYPLQLSPRFRISAQALEESSIMRPIGTALSALQQPGEALPLAARLIHFSWQLLEQRHQLGELPPAESLGDASLRQAYEQVRTSDWESESGQEERWGGGHNPQSSLLFLGQALEEAGDPGAGQAFAQLLSQEGISAAKVEAALGLARLSLARQDGSACLQWSAKAVELASHLGPISYALAQLERGLLLHQGGSPQAPVELKQALSMCGELPLARSLAQLALGSNEGVEFLLRAENRGEIGRRWTWMLQAVLEVSEGTVAASLLFPFAGELSELLTRGRLSLLARRRLLACCQQLQRVPEDLVTRLLADPEAEIRGGAQNLSGTQAQPLMRLLTLGYQQCHVGPKRIEEGQWKSSKAKYLLAYLAAHRGWVNEEFLLECFWPDSGPGGRRNLHNNLYYLRKCLKAHLSEDQEPILREKEALCLNPALALWHDLDEFNSAFEGGDLRRAVELYGGPFLEGCYMDWVLPIRQSLEEKHLQALARLALNGADQGRYQETLELSTRLLSIDPASQEGHLLKMRAHLGLAQPEAAIRQYKTCERVLQEELHSEPSMALVTVYQRARHGMPDEALEKMSR